MYSSILTFYVVDNYAPAIPENLEATKSTNSHPLLSWDENTEYDMDYYEIWKKGGLEGGDWHLKATT
ncbi:MAG: hypothetical protein P8X73_06780 [Ignavibacteriaceae bacterium]